MDVPPGPMPGPYSYGLDGVWRIGHAPGDPEEWAFETRLRLKETEQPVQWATGHRPENDREWELEYSFRELENRRRTDADQRELEFRVTLEASKQAAQGVMVRSWALVAIVAAIVLMPGIGMISGVAAQSFSEFIAPITGIAGTIIGYWFSQQLTPATSNGDFLGGSAIKIPSSPTFPAPRV